MRKRMCCLFAVAALAAGSLALVGQARAEEKVATMNVPGVVWTFSANKARDALKDVEGVSIVTTSQKDHEVTVVYEDGDIKKDAIQKKLENAGFYVQSVK